MRLIRPFIAIPLIEPWFSCASASAATPRPAPPIGVVNKEAGTADGTSASSEYFLGAIRGEDEHHAPPGLADLEFHLDPRRNGPRWN